MLRETTSSGQGKLHSNSTLRKEKENEKTSLDLVTKKISKAQNKGQRNPPLPKKGDFATTAPNRTARYRRKLTRKGPINITHSSHNSKPTSCVAERLLSEIDRGGSSTQRNKGLLHPASIVYTSCTRLRLSIQELNNKKMRPCLVITPPPGGKGTAVFSPPRRTPILLCKFYTTHPPPPLFFVCRFDERAKTNTIETAAPPPPRSKSNTYHTLSCAA